MNDYQDRSKLSNARNYIQSYKTDSFGTDVHHHRRITTLYAPHLAQHEPACKGISANVRLNVSANTLLVFHLLQCFSA